MGIKKRSWSAVLLPFICVVLAGLLCYKWQRVFYGVCTNDIYSDVPLHIGFALGHADYSLSSYLIRFLYAVGDEGFALTALSVCLTVNNVLGVVAVWWLIRTMLPKLEPWAAMLSSILAHICGPWIIPGYQEAIYLGAYNGNLYHNMTVLFSRTLIPVCFIYFFKCWDDLHRYWDIRRDRDKLKNWLLLTLSLLVITLFKPNFGFAFIPAVALLLLYDLIKYKGKYIANEFYLGCAVLPSGIAIIMQYLVLFDESFPGQSSSVALRFYLAGELLALAIMYIRSLLLPIFSIGLQAPKEESRGHIGLLLLVEAVSLLEAAFITETGYRATDGNFDWGSLALYPVVFALSIALLFRMLREIRWKEPLSVLKCLVGFGLLFGHLVIGVYFLYFFSTGASYFI